VNTQKFSPNLFSFFFTFDCSVHILYGKRFCFGAGRYVAGIDQKTYRWISHQIFIFVCIFVRHHVDFFAIFIGDISHQRAIWFTISHCCQDTNIFLLGKGFHFFEHRRISEADIYYIDF